MKRILFIISFFLFAYWGYSQHWLKEGATYNYHYSMHPSSGYRQLVYKKDTVFDGKACSYLNLLEQNCHVSYGGCWATNYIKNFFFHKRNDSVFALGIGTERFLFDLNPSVGDTWNYGPTPSSYNGFECNGFNYTKVDSIRTDTINGIQIKKIFVHPLTGSFYGYSGYITDRYGPASSFFDWEYSRFCRNSNMISPFNETLTCYSDSLYLGNGTICYSPFVSPVGINEISIENMKIFPNPVSQTLSINLNQSSKSTTIKIYTLTGQLVKKEIFDNSNSTLTTDIKHLPAGMYILEVETSARTNHTRLIKE